MPKIGLLRYAVLGADAIKVGHNVRTVSLLADPLSGPLANAISSLKGASAMAKKRTQLHSSCTSR
jgi:hypothetical protein